MESKGRNYCKSGRKYRFYCTFGRGGLEAGCYGDYFAIAEKA
jgi:hypothetical protein